MIKCYFQLDLTDERALRPDHFNCKRPYLEFRIKNVPFPALLTNIIQKMVSLIWNYRKNLLHESE